MSTALDLETAALNDLGVYGPGEAIPANVAQDGLTRLNRMITTWALHTLLIPTISRTIWPITANRGGPSNPYTIGPTGTFVSARPNQLEGAGLLLNGSTPPVEIPRAILTNDAFEAIHVKDLTSPLFRAVFYRPTSPNGTIILWPIPSIALNSLVLYKLEQLGTFADLSTTQYTFPDGYEEAIISNLAVRWAPSQGVIITPDLRIQAIQRLADIKRANVKMEDLAIDPMFVRDHRHATYNIETGSAG